MICRHKRHFSLRTKLTFFCTVVLVCIAAGLAAMSIWNVDRLFMRDEFINDFVIKAGDAQKLDPLVVQQMEPKDALTQPSPSEDTTYSWNETQSSANSSREVVLEGVPKEGVATVGGVEGPTDVIDVTYSVMVATQRDFNYVTLWFMLGLIVIGFLLIYFVTGRALKPVRQLSDTMRLVDENNLSQQICENYSSREISALAESFNHLLSKLDEAFTAQRNFTAAAAHELKTPLACIRANQEVLRMDETPSLEEFRHSADITQRHTERLIQLVDELMEMNRPLQPENLDEVDTQELAQMVVEELQPRIREKELQVSCDCAGTLQGDRSMLYRLLYNLIENAVKYNRQGGEILITSAKQEQTFTLSVADTGLGIPPEEAEQIFEPFYRLDKSRSRKTAGAGLGLAIVKSIAEKHGAFVSAQPRAQGGSVFTVTFYLKD